MILEAVDAALRILRHIRTLDEIAVFVSVLRALAVTRAGVRRVTRDGLRDKLLSLRRAKDSSTLASSEARRGVS